MNYQPKHNQAGRHDLDMRFFCLVNLSKAKFPRTKLKLFLLTFRKYDFHSFLAKRNTAFCNRLAFSLQVLLRHFLELICFANTWGVGTTSESVWN